MVGERGRRLLGFVRFRAVGLKLSVTAMDWASPPRGHREACARPGAVQCLSSGRSPRPACPPGAHSPCARRVGRRQPPEGVGRERERGRGLGRCRGLERGRGCGSLRRGSVSASSALLPGRRRGAAENAGSGPGPPSTLLPFRGAPASGSQSLLHPGRARDPSPKLGS